MIMLVWRHFKHLISFKRYLMSLLLTLIQLRGGFMDEKPPNMFAFPQFLSVNLCCPQCSSICTTFVVILPATCVSHLSVVSWDSSVICIKWRDDAWENFKYTSTPTVYHLYFKSTCLSYLLYHSTLTWITHLHLSRLLDLLPFNL
jgi:hypothetical protein